MLSFLVNLTPLGIPEKVQKAVEESLTNIYDYPDQCKENLANAISRRYHVASDKICVGNGASDVIFRTVFTLKPKKALVLAPMFGEYEAALKCVDAKIDYYQMNHTDFKVKDDIMDQITEEVDMLCICNPNNPTGTLMPKEQVLKVLEHCEKNDCWMVVDECFLEFVQNGEDYSAMDCLENSSRLIIIKSFTKMYGIAGLRLGYALCGQDGLAGRIDHAGCDWNVNIVAEAAGLASLESEDYENKVLEYTTREREWMAQKLSDYGFRVMDCVANFLFFQASSNGKDSLGDYLMQQDIEIRKCGDYENAADDYYRVAVNLHENNVKLIEAIGGWVI